jgi:hypothetical protein
MMGTSFRVLFTPILPRVCSGDMQRVCGSHEFFGAAACEENRSCVRYQVEGPTLYGRTARARSAAP